MLMIILRILPWQNLVMSTQTRVKSTMEAELISFRELSQACVEITMCDPEGVDLIIIRTKGSI